MGIAKVGSGTNLIEPIGPRWVNDEWSLVIDEKSGL
jgi:hypothetical protein